MEIINTCFATTQNYHGLAFYSHLIPLAAGLLISLILLIKTRCSDKAVAFSAFLITFSIWLLGNLITWIVSDYYQVYYWWSWLDYVNLIFFGFGLYFFILVSRGTVKPWEKILMIALPVPLFILEITTGAVVGFHQPWCEAIQVPFGVQYKFYGTMFYSLLLLIYIIRYISTKEINKTIKRNNFVVGSSILFFFLTFGISEYISSVTFNYEINLYANLILPIFIVIISSSISNMGIFNLRFLGTQLLAYVLIAIIGAQFLFAQTSVDQILTIITFLSTLILCLFLIRNTNNEIKAYARIESLANDLETANVRLQKLDKLKSEFVSIASHQLRSPLTAIRGYASLLREGNYGEIPEKAMSALERIEESSKLMAIGIEDYLNVSRIESGNMKYSLSDFNLANETEKVCDDLRVDAVKRGLNIIFRSDLKSRAIIHADIGKTVQVLQNLIHNSIKYTPKGGIKVLVRDDVVRKKIFVDIEDTGIGMDRHALETIFEKFERADNANSVNISGTGLGLFVALKMTEAMGGTITAKSDGPNKGSLFTIELPLVG